MIAFLEQNVSLFIIILLIFIAIELTMIIFSNRKNKVKIHLDGGNQILRTLSEDSKDVFILFDREKRIVSFVSNNIERILGIQIEHVYADLYVLKSLLEKEERWRIEKRIQEEIEHGSPIQDEIQINCLNREDILHMKMSVTPSSDGKYWILILSDRSNEQKIREDLQKQIVEVQAIDEAKTQFLSKMSHEIRTPMNGMLGMISLAKLSQQRKEYESVNGYLEKAEGLTQFLLSIINDILDMSRIESGKLVLENASFRIRDLAEKLRTMFETTIQEKGITFSVELQNFTVTNVVGDELRISQVLTNFLSNASKFTSKGGHITLSFRQMEVIDDHVSIMFRVKDDGIGMEPEFLHRIFIPFEQESSGTARKFGGSGLGMAISDNLVRMMGSQILVDSKPNAGTEFTVFLDLPIGENTKDKDINTEEVKEISLKDIRILMAEDNNVNAMVTTKLLEQLEMKIERVENGQLCVDAFAGHTAGYYDAILMDLHMPVLDGWEATKQIRTLDQTDAKSIPIIALSADAFVEDKRHSIEVGMNGHVAKPIDYKELQQVLKKCIAARNEG